MIVPHKFDWIHSMKDESKQEYYLGKLQTLMVVFVMLIRAVHLSSNEFNIFLFLILWDNFTFPWIELVAICWSAKNHLCLPFELIFFVLSKAFQYNLCHSTLNNFYIILLILIVVKLLRTALTQKVFLKQRNNFAFLQVKKDNKMFKHFW